MKLTRDTKGICCTIFGGICWGISGTCGQYLCSVQGMDTRSLTAIRLLGAGSLMLLLAWFRQRDTLLRLLRTPKVVLHCLLFGVFGLMMTQYSYLTTISKTNAGTATVLQQVSSALLLLVVCATARRRPTRREAAAILCCLTGTFLIATHGSLSQLSISRDGLAWGLLSAVAVSLYILIPQNLLKDWGSLIPIGLGMLCGGLAFSGVMRVWRIPLSFTPGSALITAVIVLIGTVLAFPLFLKGTSIVGPARGNMIGCVEPLVATLCSAVFLQTRFAPMDLVGFALVLSTVFILAKD